MSICCKAETATSVYRIGNLNICFVDIMDYGVSIFIFKEFTSAQKSPF
jgi:hypothetical protein